MTLILHRETLRSLTPEEQSHVHGGTSFPPTPGTTGACHTSKEASISCQGC
jgi:hypothetical protein